jgi:hypothetical protein
MDDIFVQARSALLDALTALREHRNSVVVIGAQAIYLHTGNAPVAVAEATKDSDLAIDPRTLEGDPLIEAAMTAARFFLDPASNQPGAWMSPRGIPVDLMVPEAIAGRGNRSAEVPPHGKRSMRRAVGLEAAVIDNAEMKIYALSEEDQRHLTARVAGPAALLVAKMHKIAERKHNPKRLVDKDAHDSYRLLITVPTDDLSASLRRLLSDDLAGDVTRSALAHVSELFAAGPTALGCEMAGRTELGLGDPDVVAASCAALASDLLAAVDARDI